jgi:hypothetical protein
MNSELASSQDAKLGVARINRVWWLNAAKFSSLLDVF